MEEGTRRNSVRESGIDHFNTVQIGSDFLQKWSTSFRYHKQNKRISVFSWLRLRGMREMNPKMDPTVENSVIFHLIHPWIWTWNHKKWKGWFSPFSTRWFSIIFRRVYSLTSPNTTVRNQSQPSRDLVVPKRCGEDSTVRCSEMLVLKGWELKHQYYVLIFRAY